MAVLWREHKALIIITYFCTRKSSIKETAIPDKDNILAMLSLCLSLVVFQLGGLHYRLCYSIKLIITFNEGLGGLHYRLCYSIKLIITFNEGLGLQLLVQNS